MCARSDARKSEHSQYLSQSTIINFNWVRLCRLAASSHERFQIFLNSKFHSNDNQFLHTTFSIWFHCRSILSHLFSRIWSWALIPHSATMVIFCGWCDKQHTEARRRKLVRFWVGDMARLVRWTFEHVRRYNRNDDYDDSETNDVDHQTIN